jgi:hypothetical protein
MRCSHCYAENEAWATICSACGQAVLRLEFCPGGHLLPPGVRDCPVCPSLWPEVSSFAGPPLLRGLLWVETGRLAPAADPGRELAYLEVRDQENPIGLILRPTGAVHVTTNDDEGVSCRILMRPEGVQVCDKSRPREGSGAPSYVVLRPGEKLALGGTTLRHQEVQPPLWAQKLAQGQGRQARAAPGKPRASG